MKKDMPLLRKFKMRVNANLVGVDIEPDSVRLIKINRTTSPFKVEMFAIAPVPAGAIVKNEIKDYAAIGFVLKEIFRHAQLTTKSLALAIPRSLAIIKNIPIDSRFTAEEIESRAWIEANRHFPDLIGDINLDFTVTGQSLSDPSQLDLMLVACRKDHIKPYLEIAKQAGLVAKIVDVNCYALERALPLVIQTPVPHEAYALLNLNLHLSSFIVSRDQKLLHAHDQTYDGQRLMTQTSNYLKDKVIDSAALIDDQGYTDILKENLISHLRHTVHFFYSSRSNTSIKQLILAGDCAFTPALAAFIERELGIETKLAEPFTHLQVAPEVNVEELKKMAPILILSCGLALSEVQPG